MTSLVGGAVLVDADDGAMADAAVSSVSGVALFADGSPTFVADLAG